MKITIHTPPSTQSNQDDHKAIEVLRKFSALEDVEIYGFSELDSPKIEINKTRNNEKYDLEVFWNDGSKIWASGFPQERANRRHWGNAIIINNDDTIDNDEELSAIREQTKCVEAHRALRNHIFVTSSTYLHEIIDYHEDSNIHTPKQALKILGLFLRSRGLWLYEPNFQTAPSNFYSHGLHLGIPNYLACARSIRLSGKVFSEDINNQLLGFAEKCRRILKTKDILGSLFYRMQTQETLDDQLYYFGYITLLISGAFDSLAEVAAILYKPKRRGFISFRNKDGKNSFVSGLRKAGAGKLVDLIDSKRERNLQLMLTDFRNTIHKDLPRGVKARDFDKRDESCFELDQKFRDKIWNVALELGGNEKWGLERENYSLQHDKGNIEKKYRIKMEPFNYSVQLLENWFPFFDELLEIMKQADVENEVPAHDKEVREIVSLMG